VVPILSEDRVLGVLSAQSYRPEAYGEADVLSLEAIAVQAGVAINRLRHDRRGLQLEAVLATISDAILIVDARGAIVQLNRAARELLGLDNASLVLGQPVDQRRLEQWPATAREFAAAFVPVIEALRAGTSVANVEFELRSSQRRVFSMSASTLRSSQGLVQGGVIVLHDITGQRHLERLREDIFHMAWHDMETPIALVRGHAELLVRRLSSGDNDRKALQTDAESIVTHTDRLAALVTTLLDVASLEAGLLTISRCRTDLRSLAREVTKGMQPVARHDIVVLDGRSVEGEWDERRIRQVLTNLLSNATKYSPEGSPVTVSVTSDERSATVRVRDEGIGLDGAELAQLFRRGYRAESARAIPGAGVGLYFSSGIVAAHGGRIWAESPGPGRGSTFCFTLPLRVEPGATHPAEDRP
jgi:PAS domain S-box-containing protein